MSIRIIQFLYISLQIHITYLKSSRRATSQLAVHGCRDMGRPLRTLRGSVGAALQAFTNGFFGRQDVLLGMTWFLWKCRMTCLFLIFFVNPNFQKMEPWFRAATAHFAAVVAGTWWNRKGGHAEEVPHQPSKVQSCPIQQTLQTLRLEICCGVSKVKLESFLTSDFPMAKNLLDCFLASWWRSPHHSRSAKIPASPLFKESQKSSMARVTVLNIAHGCGIQTWLLEGMVCEHLVRASNPTGNAVLWCQFAHGFQYAMSPTKRLCFFLLLDTVQVKLTVSLTETAMIHFFGRKTCRWLNYNCFL